MSDFSLQHMGGNDWRLNTVATPSPGMRQWRVDCFFRGQWMAYCHAIRNGGFYQYTSQQQPVVKGWANTTEEAWKMWPRN